MPYAPGPFGQASPADIHVAPGVYDFTDDAAGLQGDLHAIGQGWDSMIDDLEAVASEPWDVQLGLDLDGMIGAIDYVSSTLPPPYIDQMLNGWFTTQTLLDSATSFAPSQAWTDPGESFVPPDSALTLVAPTIDQSAFVEAPNQAVGATTEGRNPAVGLFNITRYGSQNFSVGDDFEVVALGKEGDDLTVEAKLNGETLPQVDYGQMDSSGQLFIKGKLGPETKGVWNEKWYINGQIMANFNFVVSD